MKTQSIIKQSVVLPASAETLFAQYLEPRKHAAITGAPVLISRRPGSRFEAFGGALSGHTLAVLPNLVVQSWRSTNFGKDAPDSTLILRFRSAGKGRGRIDLLHIDVPQVDYKGVSQGWRLYYWRPWRKYLAQ